MRLPLMAAAILYVVAPAAAQSRQSPPFTFSKPDTTLFEECGSIDRQLENRGLLLTDQAFEARLRELGAPSIPRTGLERVTWQFRVLRDPSPQSFALPNGSVYVPLGLLARIENEDQLAGLLAHHVHHVAARDGYLANRAFRKNAAARRIASMGAAVIAGGFALLLGETRTVAAQLIANDAYSRDSEAAADTAALDVLKSSGREPSQFARLLSILEDRLDPEWSSVLYVEHPTPGERLARLPVPPDPLAREDGYLGRVASLVMDDIPIAIDGRKYRSAVAAAERLAAARPDDALRWFWLGEGYRALGPRTPRPRPDELKPAAQRSALRALNRETPEEEARRLASTTEGREALNASRAKSEAAYRKAAALDPSSPKPHVGLGMLYQEMGRREAALTEFRRYIELAGSDPDRPRVERRIQELTKELNK